MIGRSLHVERYNALTDSCHFRLTMRPWKFNSSGVLVYGTEVELLNLTYGASAAWGNGETFPNSTDLWLGADFVFTATPSAAVSGVAAVGFAPIAESLSGSAPRPGDCHTLRLTINYPTSSSAARTTSGRILFGCGGQSTLGTYWRAGFKSALNQTPNFVVRARRWRLNEDNSLAFAADNDYLVDVQAFTPGTWFYSGVQNNSGSTPDLGAEVSLNIIDGTFSSLTGTIQVVLQRSTDGTTWPSDGQGALVREFSLSAVTSGGPRYVTWMGY